MAHTEQQISERLSEIGEALRDQPSVRDAVMRRVTTADVARPAPGLRPFGRVGKFLALAACAVIALALWNTFGSRDRMLGADAAFAAAIENVAKAKTFAARQIVTDVDENGRRETHETAVMFKEPNLERIEWLKGLPGQVVVTDYAKRQRLLLLPDEKIAVMQDISTLYVVDEASGKLHPSQLQTGIREQVLKITGEAVKDLGAGKVDGKDVRVLQSEGGGEPVKKVYVDPKTNSPVQIELLWPSKKLSFVYAAIQIDADLDPSLFSLEVPAGYKLKEEKGSVIAADNGKMLAKMKYLVMECYKYSSKHDNQFPDKLDDLKKTMKEQALRTMLAAPEQPDGPPVIEYRKPRAGRDSGTEIVVYETEKFRRPGQVVVGMWDGHSEILSQEKFEELMK